MNIWKHIVRLRGFGKVCSACKPVTIVDEDNVPYVEHDKLAEAQQIIRDTMSAFLRTYDILPGQTRITEFFSKL